MDTMDIFRKRLKEARMEKDFTQKHLAELAGCTAAAISGYETDKKPSIEIVSRIAKHLNVSIDWLCGFDVNEKALETYADLFQRILCICNAFDKYDVSIDTSNSKDMGYTNYPDYDKSELVGVIAIRDAVTASFFKELKKMFELKSTGTITEDLFKLWFEDKLKSHNNELPMLKTFISE